MRPTTRVGGLDATLQGRLAQRESQGKLRHLDIPKSHLVDFSSNDYLSLSQDLVVRDALVAHLNHPDQKPSPASNERMIGSGGSRLLDGNSAFAEHLERKISDFHSSEAALLFNSAYDASSMQVFTMGCGYRVPLKESLSCIVLSFGILEN
jgi:8-amino-7-oxononanoate synthase